MRRTLLALALLALSYGMTAPATRATEPPSPQALCEAYCMLAAIQCYLGPGLIMGHEKCDAQYRGCIKGCIAAIRER